MRLLTLEKWKTLKDPDIDTSFVCWCYNNGIDPHSVYTAKAWAALFEGFMNDWLDTQVNRLVSRDAIDDIIDPPTRPTMEFVRG